MLSLYTIAAVIQPCCGYMLSRASVDGVPSDLVTVTIGDDEYPQSVEILTSPTDWVIKNYTDGSQDATLPVSIIAQHVLEFLKQRIAVAEAQDDTHLVNYLTDMQAGWTQVRADQLKDEVYLRGQKSLERNDRNKVAAEHMDINVTPPTIDGTVTRRTAAMLALALCFIILDCLMAILIVTMVCSPSRRPSLTDILTQSRGAHYVIASAPRESQV